MGCGVCLSVRLSVATASYNGLLMKLGSCTRAEASRVGRTRRPHNLFSVVDK